ncbi:MAG: Hpt domain-containing protein [Sideroxydans sp.]|nr:Hpt domain-containing protein [Sideroxydans sp.]
MNNAQHQAALAVVKPGITEALTVIQAQLAIFFAHPGAQITPLQIAIAEVKRIAGACQMVAMPGLAVFCAELEQGFIELAVRPAQASVLHNETFSAALQNFSDYLSEIEQGADNATLRVFPSYEKLQHLRGLEMSFDEDLFFPDLAVQLPANILAAVEVSDAAAQLKAARNQYQQGLLGYLRQPDKSAALQQMQQALHSIRASIPADLGRAYWWVAEEFLACVSVGGQGDSVNVSRLLSRLDAQARALIEARPVETLPEINQMLYVIGRAANGSRSIKTIYDLDRYLPAPNSLAPSQLNKRLLVIGEQLTEAEESLERAQQGDVAALTAYQAQTTLIAQYCQLLNEGSIKTLANDLAAFAKQYKADDTQTLLGLSLALAMLGLQRAVRDYRRLDGGFAEQTVLLSDDMQASAEGKYLADTKLLRFAELSSHSSSRDALAPLSKALGDNLRQVESVLTALFEDAEQRDGLGKLPALLAQVAGALALIEHHDAALLARDLHTAVETLSHHTSLLSLPESRALANAVSSLDSYCQVLADTAACGALQDALIAATHGLRAQSVLLPNTVALVKASNARVAAPPSSKSEDAELLEIFLEEAREVLTIVQENLELSQLHPDTQAYVVTIRRGFHTLKGSGRMVGLIDLGDVAWHVERAMNAWLKEERPISPALIAMIELAIRQFGEWVSSLQKTGRAQIVADELKQCAAQIENPHAPVALTASPASPAAAEPHDSALSFSALDEAMPVSAAPAASTALELSIEPQADAPLEFSIEPAVAVSAPAALSLASSSEEVVQTSENLELEILEIFLEEAAEVLSNLQAYLALAQAQPHDHSNFVNIRRSFHTLKGSGRMVGLSKLGEVAWNVERAMNAWLKQDHAPTAGVCQMVDLAITQFGEWIASIKQHGAAHIQAGELNALAAHIEQGTPAAAVVTPDAAPSAIALDLLGDEAVAQIAQVAPVLAEIAPAAPVLAQPAEPVTVADAAAVQEEAGEPDAIQIGSVSLSPTLFSIGTEESKQNVAKLRSQLSALRELEVAVIEYDFMRAAHTIVGVNRAMGFVPVVELASALESWLLMRIEHAFDLIPAQFTLLENSIEKLAQMLAQISAQHYPDAAADLVQALQQDKEKLKNTTPLASVITPVIVSVKQDDEPQVHDEIDTQLLPIFLEEADELIPKIGEALRQLRAQPNDTEPLHLLNRLLHTAKGSARMAGAMRLGDVAHKMEDKILNAGGLKHDAHYWEQLDGDYDFISALLEELRTGKPALVAATPATQGSRSSDAPVLAAVAQLEIGAERAMQANMLRVRADVLDRMVNEASEISVARSRMEAELRAFKEGLLELTGSVMRLRKQVREVEIQAETQMQARVSVTQDSAEQFDPLEFDRFTRLQELTRFLNESVHDVQTVQQTLLKNLDETSAAMSAQARLNRELQQSLMNIRMVPFNSINDRLYRIVRQTSKQLGKRANLDLIGTGVEIDRSVLEKMTAPFEHLLRNAIAHGLENEAQREQAGKVPFGDIRLVVSQENNEVVFTLSDDGAGLDFAALREKAIAKGLLPTDDNSSEAELTQLIFATGLTTASEVSEIAGRGIGMDVVRSEIAGLGGRIDVQSTTAKGTQFTIHLPLTLAVTQVLMVRCNDATYAIPAAMVTQVRQVKAADMAALYQANQMDWQGVSYPLQYLPTLLDEHHAAAATQARNTVLLLKSGASLMALHVDELLGNQEAVVKNIGPQLSRLAGIAGATVRGDGAVVLILNPLQMQRRHQQPARPSSVAVEVASKPLVMVVDDSLTVRKITTRLLTRSGYEVVTAKDGVDALEQLRDIKPMVMLVDVEMPRMDGFELTKEVRRAIATKAIPIIMITSRTADKHREHAMQLGVNAYLGKPYQEDDLLARIAAFVAGK